MFPQLIRPLIKCTPIFVVIYGPAKLIINFTISQFVKVLTAQILYLVISITILIFVYERGVKKINVNGG